MGVQATNVVEREPPDLVGELLGHPVSSMNLFQQGRLQSLERKEIAKVDERDRARRVGGRLQEDGTNHNYRIIRVIIMSKRIDICHLRILSLLSNAFYNTTNQQ
jgi:hypothetical protein